MQDSLALQFRKDIDEGRLLHPDTYKKVTSGCIAAIRDAPRPQRVVLFCALSLADALEHELEAEAIVKEAEAIWRKYARHLEEVLRISGSGPSDTEIVRILGEAVAAIFPPTGHP